MEITKTTRTQYQCSGGSCVTVLLGIQLRVDFKEDGKYLIELWQYTDLGEKIKEELSEPEVKTYDLQKDFSRIHISKVTRDGVLDTDSIKDNELGQMSGCVRVYPEVDYN